MIAVFVDNEENIKEVFKDEIFNLIKYNNIYEIKRYICFNTFRIYVIKIGGEYRINLPYLNFDNYILMNDNNDINYFSYAIAQSIDLDLKIDTSKELIRKIYENKSEEYIVNDIVDNIENYDENYIVIKNNTYKAYRFSSNKEIEIKKEEIPLVYRNNIDYAKKIAIFEINMGINYMIDDISENENYIYFYMKGEEHYNILNNINIEPHIKTSYMFIKENNKYRIYINCQRNFIKGKLLDNPIKINFISELKKYQ